MDENRDKPAETGHSHLWAARLLVDWLEREGGNNKSRRALAVLASMTVAELGASRSPPISEVEQLSNNYFDRYGGSRGDTAAGRWLRRSEIERWWQSRESSIEQWFRAAGSPWIPAITVADGGGRGNSTEYSFRFDDMPEFRDEFADQSLQSPDAGSADINAIVYTREPAEPAFWLGWLLKHPFPTLSWRGFVLIVTLGIVMVTTLFLWFALAFVLLTKQPALVRISALIAFYAVIASAGWWSMRPFWELPLERITAASDLILSMRQIYAQLRLTREKGGKDVRGWLSLERHWSTCPVCSGTIEIRSGKAAYPGRLVGRGSENPREHVYSFDAVTLTGRLLVPR
ncbi:hypothetical protein [Dyella sp. GSA-30]|uniref:hypothetical protein n=1 Tax=Dyella sp. GSA-30 TaxID=2994496 RepID=UPI0024928359|nr:hypothetical protein [Dyella sp. GSA-30]